MILIKEQMYRKITGSISICSLIFVIIEARLEANAIFFPVLYSFLHYYLSFFSYYIFVRPCCNFLVVQVCRNGDFQRHLLQHQKHSSKQELIIVYVCCSIL